MSVASSILNPSQWVSNHADYLYHYALSRLNDAELAADLVQETFLAALEKTPGFEGKSTERTWLTAILKYKVIDVYRQKAKTQGAPVIERAEKSQQSFFDENGHWVPEHYPRPFGDDEKGTFHNKEFEKVMNYCLQKLPNLWIAVFTMKYLDEQAETICSSLKLTQSNYWVIVHRAKLNLRACLQKAWIS